MKVDLDLEPYRAELTAYTYRLLGSSFEAEDAVQETMLRAWRNSENFEGRSSLRTWLYRIATNVSFDMLSASQRRALPMDLGPAKNADDAIGNTLPEAAWIQPIPDTRVVPSESDPAEVAEVRDSVRLAFITALQQLPSLQRAVLILRDVLHWQASEVADLLDTTVPSVNSALQRARASLDAINASVINPKRSLDADQQALLGRYVDAFERYDMNALTALLHEDATWSMPPYDFWLQTHADIEKWCLGPGIRCRGSRLVATTANGSPAFAQYRLDPDGKGFDAWSLQVLEISSGKISGISFFLGVETLFPLFGLPLHLDR